MQKGCKYQTMKTEIYCSGQGLNENIRSEQNSKLWTYHRQRALHKTD